MKLGSARLILSTFSLFLSLCACQNDVSPTSTSAVPSMTLDQLQAAPEALEVTGNPVLSAYLWRDFMPSPVPKDSPLMAVVKLTSPDQQPIMNGVRLAYLWVINDGEIWASTLQQSGSAAEGLLSGFATGGPHWDTGITVDVVVGVKVGKSLRLVRLPNQVIHATF